MVMGPGGIAEGPRRNRASDADRRTVRRPRRCAPYRVESCIRRTASVAHTGVHLRAQSSTNPSTTRRPTCLHAAAGDANEEIGR